MTRILLVEDDPNVADSMIRAFDLRGIDVQWAMSKHDAEAVIDNSGPFDLAILDLNLPDGLGTELLASLKKVRTCVYSGLPDDAEAAAKAAGFPDVPCFSKGSPMELWNWIGL